ncbi:transposase [Providencia vermicola]
MAGNKWQISDELWEKLAPLIPEHRTQHPLGMHRKRVDNRAAMNAIFFVLADGLPVECAKCHRYMLVKLCSSPISGVAGCWRI